MKICFRRTAMKMKNGVCTNSLFLQIQISKSKFAIYEILSSSTGGSLVYLYVSLATLWKNKISKNKQVWFSFIRSWLVIFQSERPLITSWPMQHGSSIIIRIAVLKFYPSSSRSFFSIDRDDLSNGNMPDFPRWNEEMNIPTNQNEHVFIGTVLPLYNSSLYLLDPDLFRFSSLFFIAWYLYFHHQYKYSSIYFHQYSSVLI